MMEGARRLRVGPCGSKGSGLVATATKADKDWKKRGAEVVVGAHGRVRVFQRGAKIDQLTGLLVPDDKKYDDGWSLEIRRGDLHHKAPVSGRIYCRFEGNIMRFCNSSCDPNGAVVWARCSGRYVAIVEALRDIFDGDELTFSYGTEYFSDESPCQCGSENCRFRE